jgi:hypothetical protein
MRTVERWQLALLVAVVAVLGMSGAIAYSLTASGQSSAVKACFNPSSGNLRAAKSSNDCVRGESLVDWSQIQSQGSIVLPRGQAISLRMNHSGPIGP